jgi:hypothetical protein
VLRPAPLAFRAKTREVVIKMMAATVVTLPMRVAGPRAPKTDELVPPKAAPSPEPLPVCRRTLIIKTKAMKMCSVVTAVIILCGTLAKLGFFGAFRPAPRGAGAL